MANSSMDRDLVAWLRQQLLEANPDLLRELDRQPDLADFSQDSRFKQLLENLPKGGS